MMVPMESIKERKLLENYISEVEQRRGQVMILVK
jgi:hypothetical protein